MCHRFFFGSCFLEADGVSKEALHSDIFYVLESKTAIAEKRYRHGAAESIQVHSDMSRVIIEYGYKEIFALWNWRIWKGNEYMVRMDDARTPKRVARDLNLREPHGQLFLLLSCRLIDFADCSVYSVSFMFMVIYSLLLLWLFSDAPY